MRRSTKLRKRYLSKSTAVAWVIVAASSPDGHRDAPGRRRARGSSRELTPGGGGESIAGNPPRHARREGPAGRRAKATGPNLPPQVEAIVHAGAHDVVVHRHIISRQAVA